MSSRCCFCLIYVGLRVLLGSLLSVCLVVCVIVCFGLIFCVLVLSSRCFLLMFVVVSVRVFLCVVCRSVMWLRLSGFRVGCGTSSGVCFG